MEYIKRGLIGITLIDVSVLAENFRIRKDLVAPCVVLLWLSERTGEITAVSTVVAGGRPAKEP